MFNFKTPHSPNSSLLSKAKSTALGKSLTTQYSTNQWFHSATPRMWAKYREWLIRQSFFLWKTFGFPQEFQPCAIVMQWDHLGNRFFLGGVGRLSLWSCFVGTGFEQPVIDSKAEWAPRLCPFRVGQLKSLAIQILLNDGLSRSSSSTSKNVSSFVYHELIFFSFVSLRH